MTDYRDRVLKGMLVPAALLATNQPASTVTTSSIREHLAAADIDFLERVHGLNSRDNDFVMLVDGDGRDRALRYNPRAHYLSGYPLAAPILGNVLFFSEGYGDEGMDIQDLTDTGEAWLTATERTDGYSKWLVDNAGAVSLYTMRFPGRI